ncbi:MAG: hypothetical protein ACOCZ5_02650 [bacterium]
MTDRQLKWRLWKWLIGAVSKLLWATHSGYNVVEEKKLLEELDYKIKEE